MTLALRPRLPDPTTLRLFVAVCEEGHIARAAEREAIVASAVSKRLAALEDGLGVALFQRSRRGIRLSAAGEALLRRAREVLAGLDQLQAEIQEFAGGLQGSVRILASPSALAERLPEDIASFLADHPGVRVQMDEVASVTIVRQLHEGMADLGLTWDAVDHTGLQGRPWRADRLCVAMPPGHPLARRPALAFAEVLDQISVGVVVGGLVDLLIKRQAALLGRQLLQRIQVSTLDAACRIVSAGLGLAIVPREAIAPHADSGRLALVPLSDDWALRRFVLIHRQQEAGLSPSAQLLLRHLAACASRSAAGGSAAAPA